MSYNDQNPVSGANNTRPSSSLYNSDFIFNIREVDDRYEIEIFGCDHLGPFKINMSSNDLAELNNAIHDKLWAIFTNRGTDWSSSTEKETILELAGLGKHAFIKIFNVNDPQELIAINDRLSSGRCIINIISKSFYFPWELLYPTNLDEHLSYEHFWGMNHIIYYTPKNVVRETIIHFNTRPKLGLLFNNNLPCVISKELPFFEKLEAEGKIVLFKLRALNPEDRLNEIKEFKSFLAENAFDLAHFACHVVCDHKYRFYSSILLSDNFPISLLEMDEIGNIRNRPLVILNACETGQLDPRSASFFAIEFLDRGARGVLATHCSIRDDFAADFAVELYNRLLSGSPLGECLLDTRRYFWNKYNNPSGLLYSMYALPATRLAPIGGQ